MIYLLHIFQSLFDKKVTIGITFGLADKGYPLKQPKQNCQKSGVFPDKTFAQNFMAVFSGSKFFFTIIKVNYPEIF